MRTTISHPVPVRWTPARAKRDQIAFDVAVTPVEIPEVAHGAIERNESGYSLRDGFVPFRIHEGRCFERVTAGMLDLPDAPGGRPATVSEVLEHLAASRFRHSLLMRPGTPLCGLANAHTGVGDRGFPVVDEIHSRAIGDNTAAARQALLRYVKDCMVTDGEAFYVARSMPVIHLSAWKTNYVLDRHPAGIAEGIGFEPSRFRRIGFVTKHMAGWYSRGEIARKIHKSAASLLAAFENIPYAGDDLAAFRNDGPEAVSRLLLRARERKIPEQALAAAQVAEIRLRPHADLGRIGAIPPADEEAVEDLVCTAARALGAAVPAGVEMLGLRPLAAYIEGVIKPLHLAATVPEDDADALEGLTPAP